MRTGVVHYIYVENECTAHKHSIECLMESVLNAHNNKYETHTIATSNFIMINLI